MMWKLGFCGNSVDQQQQYNTKLYINSCHFHEFMCAQGWKCEADILGIKTFVIQVI